MSRWNEMIVGWLDRSMERTARTAAQSNGRRSFLTRLGVTLVGGAVLPMLPFDRSFAAGGESSENDQTNCEYWAYCALHGVLCNSCGGSITACPPGSEASKVAWIGTCTNPNDKKDYLVSYNDCCGKTSCTRSLCSHAHGERPGYRMGLSSDMNWCMANTSKGVHCTVAIVVGVAERE